MKFIDPTGLAEEYAGFQKAVEEYSKNLEPMEETSGYITDDKYMDLIGLDLPEINVPELEREPLKFDIDGAKVESDADFMTVKEFPYKAEGSAEFFTEGDLYFSGDAGVSSLDGNGFKIGATSKNGFDFLTLSGDLDFDSMKVKAKAGVKSFGSEAFLGGSAAMFDATGGLKLTVMGVSLSANLSGILGGIGAHAGYDLKLWKGSVSADLGIATGLGGRAKVKLDVDNIIETLSEK